MARMQGKRLARCLILTLSIGGAIIIYISTISPWRSSHDKHDLDKWQADMEKWQNDFNEKQVRETKQNQVETKPTPQAQLDKYSFDANTKLLDYFSLDKNSQKDLNEKVTVVTMYLNIGEFQKGEIVGGMFTPKLYRRWMKTFASLENPVVAFFDDANDKEYFDNIRRRLGPDKTKTFLLHRSQLWSFGMLEDIRKIFKKVPYPKHHPNTVVPEYSCAMHAKYEMMTAASRENFFNTTYFAWLDLGLFRSEAASEGLPFFEIGLPPNFNKTSVAYTEVFPRSRGTSPQAVIFRNDVWVCGCFFIGEVHTMIQWSEQYRAVTENLVYKHKLMSTDQQVIYILFNSGHPKVPIQTYKTRDPKYNEWFYLGYLAKEAGDVGRGRN